ncbi:MAG: 50S ribosomal protein L25 [Desulfohalobiaceae bacterium]
MAEHFSLEVEERNGTGKGLVRKMRRKGYIPGVYYDRKGENIPVQAPYGPLESIYYKAHMSNVIDLHIQKEGQVTKKPVLIWGVQEHPVKKLIMHVDFLGVDLTRKMEVDAQIEVQGTAKGEEEGGLVTIYRESIGVVCLPTAIPDSIVLDVSHLEINDSIYLNDIELPEGVVLQEHEENFAVVGVAPPESAAEAEETEAEEAGPGEESGSEEQE